jgi:hypothetical protein
MTQRDSCPVAEIDCSSPERIRHARAMETRPMKRSPAEVLRAMVEAFNTGDLGGVDDYIDPGYLDHQGLGSGPMNGRGGSRAIVETTDASTRSSQ